jgi:hypothetical protein
MKYFSKFCSSFNKSIIRQETKVEIEQYQCDKEDI